MQNNHRAAECIGVSFAQRQWEWPQSQARNRSRVFGVLPLFVLELFGQTVAGCCVCLATTKPFRKWTDEKKNKYECRQFTVYEPKPKRFECVDCVCRRGWNKTRTVEGCLPECVNISRWKFHAVSIRFVWECQAWFSTHEPLSTMSIALISDRLLPQSSLFNWNK